MMGIENPTLSLKRLNDLQGKIIENSALAKDYEDIDYLIVSIGGNKNYLASILNENGFSGFDDYIKERKSNNPDKIIQINKTHGATLGVLSFLKSYALKNHFY